MISAKKLVIKKNRKDKYQKASDEEKKKLMEEILAIKDK